MSRDPIRMLTLKGSVERRHEADALATQPGDAVLVHRGKARAFVIACPDGCGERLTINLDPALGPPWRFYQTPRGVTLFPSVWRDSGCGSHFIVWNSSLIWCDRWEDGNREPETSSVLLARVHAQLTDELRNYVDIATQLNEIPWDVQRACRILVRAGSAHEGAGKQRGHYRRR
jgi:hypothetical protein